MWLDHVLLSLRNLVGELGVDTVVLVIVYCMAVHGVERAENPSTQG
jgi:hypothetical protein